MWRVSYLRAAADELDSLPALEQVAIEHAVEKLEVAGIRLPAPHCAPVKGVEGALKVPGGSSGQDVAAARGGRSTREQVLTNSRSLRSRRTARRIRASSSGLAVMRLNAWPNGKNIREDEGR